MCAYQLIRTYKSTASNPMKANKVKSTYKWVTTYKTKKQAKAAEQAAKDNSYSLVSVEIVKLDKK